MFHTLYTIIYTFPVHYPPGEVMKVYKRELQATSLKLGILNVLKDYYLLKWCGAKEYSIKGKFYHKMVNIFWKLSM